MPSKRTIVYLLILLMLGAIVNVAVAWGCAMADGRVRGFIQLSSAERQSLWTSYAPEGFPPFHWEGEDAALRSEHGAGARRIGSVWRMTEIEKEPDARGNPSEFLVGRTDFGLPLRSLFGVITSAGPVSDKSNARFRYYALSPIRFSNKRYDEGWLPVGIVPVGFAINTLFYATILWALFAVPAALRRKRRIKRGLCPKCAYPIGASDVCTECGAAVRPPSHRAKQSG